jgi:hypothetical protein
MSRVQNYEQIILLYALVNDRSEKNRYLINMNNKRKWRVRALSKKKKVLKNNNNDSKKNQHFERI